MIKYVQTLVDDIAILPNENYAHFYANFFNKQILKNCNFVGDFHPLSEVSNFAFLVGKVCKYWSKFKNFIVLFW